MRVCPNRHTLIAFLMIYLSALTSPPRSRRPSLVGILQLLEGLLDGGLVLGRNLVANLLQLVLVLDKFDSILSSVIDSHLGLPPVCNLPAEVG